MDVILSLAYLVLFGLVIFKISFFRNIPGLPIRLILMFFLLKVISGVALILIYAYYYDLATADFDKYFSDGQIMYRAIFVNPVDYLRMLTGLGSEASHLKMYYQEMSHWYRPWELPVYNDNRVIIRFNAFVSIFSFGSIYVHNVFMNALSLFGLVALYRFFAKYTDSQKIHWLPWGVFLFPSLMFWGSGILKEGFLLLAAGIWLLYCDRIMVSGRLRLIDIILVLFSGFILFLLKPYNLLFLIPCQIAFYLSKGYSLVSRQGVYAATMMIWVLLGLVVGWMLPQYNIIALIARKQNDFITYSLAIDAGSLMHANYLKAKLTDMIAFLPQAFFYALLRPHILEAYSPVVLMAALENLLIVFLIVYMMIRFDKKSKDNPLISYCIWFSVALLAFIGLVTPVHGALVRYKILALPFIWVIFINLTRLPNTTPLHKNKVIAKMLFQQN